MAISLKKKIILSSCCYPWRTFNLEKHIQLTENKGSKNVFYKISKLINPKCLWSIYFSFLHSYINYENIVWSSTNKTKHKKLFGVQKQAECVLFNQGRFTHVGSLIETLNALKVYQINLLPVLLQTNSLGSSYISSKQ